MRTSLTPLGKRLSTIAAATCVLTACAMLPLVPDRNARAPLLEGFGTVDLPVSSSSAAARQWFAQGMAQAYAFNEAEAVRAFKAGLAQDPNCALCAWGVAYQLGPTINSPRRGDLNEALRHVDHALRHASGVTQRERDLIEAMALRYAHGSQARNTAPLQAEICGTDGSGNTERADPLDLAYAERMRSLVERYPNDPDILSLYAESELVATRGDWWDKKTGRPSGRIGEVATRLEAALQSHPGHTGLNHYLIHSVDDVHVAGRAVAAADRLGALAPASPHLLHMPSHTYALVGRYADATRVNQQAMTAEAAQDVRLQQQGFQPSKDWRRHNSHFQWYGAVMEGRGDLALETVRAAAERATKADHVFGEFQRSLPILTLVRLERWDQVLREPLPAGGKGLATVLGEQARGVALARSGKPVEAAAALARLEPPAAALLKAHTGTRFTDKMVRGMVAMAQARLRAELALADQRFDEALAQQALAVSAANDVDSTEPPMLGAGARVALGEMQLRAKAWAAAEQSFRADLAEHPLSGWAQHGLARALQAQGRPAEAASQMAALAQSWPAADALLRARQ